MVYAYVVKPIIIRHALGIIRPETFYAKHVRFIFPGKNSWAGEFEGKVAVGAWLRRSHQAGSKMRRKNYSAEPDPGHFHEVSRAEGPK